MPSGPIQKRWRGTEQSTFHRFRRTRSIVISSTPHPRLSGSAPWGVLCGEHGAPKRSFRVQRGKLSLMRAPWWVRLSLSTARCPICQRLCLQNNASAGSQHVVRCPRQRIGELSQNSGPDKKPPIGRVGVHWVLWQGQSRQNSWGGRLCDPYYRGWGRVRGP
jgi:hypothetical protein